MICSKWAWTSRKTCKNTDIVYMAEQFCWCTAVPKKHFVCLVSSRVPSGDCGKWQHINITSLCMNHLNSFLKCCPESCTNFMSTCESHTFMFIRLNAEQEQFVISWSCHKFYEALNVFILFDTVMTLLVVNHKYFVFANIDTTLLSPQEGSGGTLCTQKQPQSLLQSATEAKGGIRSDTNLSVCVAITRHSAYPV